MPTTFSPRSAAWLLSLTLIALVTVPHQAANAAGEDESDALDRQQFVYELNLARWNPVAYEARAGVSWTRPNARPPLALDERLGESAQFKADEMASTGYFAHQSSVTGRWPNELVREAGYPLGDQFAARANNVESLHSGSPVAFDVLTSFAKSPTHMRHVFGMDWFSTHTDVGIGRSVMQNFWAVHTAFGQTGPNAVTGVVFDDVDLDGRMDPGEGLAGVTIMIDDQRTTTNAGGGYSIRVGSGVHTVTAFGEGLTGVQSTRITVTSYNVGVDFVAGADLPIVRSYELCEGLEPTILGTSGDDVIRGTPGRDIIHGLGGRDIIDGRGGDDVICRDGAAETGAIEVMAFLRTIRSLATQPW